MLQVCLQESYDFETTLKIRYDNDVRNFTHNLYNAFIIIHSYNVSTKGSEINFKDYMAKLSCESLCLA